MSALRELDRKLLITARRRTESSPFLVTVRRYSRLGEHGAVWIALGLVTGNRRAVITILRAYTINQLLKLAIRRPRPALPDLAPLMPTHSRLSFPSAHATTSFVALRVYGDDVPRTPLAVAATAMAASRVLLGVHWPSDVAAGAALGTVLAR